MKIWLISIIIVAVFGNIVIALTGKTAQNVIIRAAVSLCIIITIVSPIRFGLIAWPTVSLPEYDTEQYRSDTKTAMIEETERQLEAYIQKRALQQDIQCTADVICEVMDNELIPVTATLCGSWQSEEEKEILVRLIEQDFGIKN